jgi:ABC-2 type transport system ATP-binding protein
VLQCTMEEFESRYLEVTVNPAQVAAARVFKPMHERQTLGRSVLLFDSVDRQQLAALGEVRTPSIADLFIAALGTMPGNVPGKLPENPAGQPEGQGQGQGQGAAR